MDISGKELSAALKKKMAEQVAGMAGKYGRVPKLDVILVGDNPASATYVRNKAKASELVGIAHDTILLPADCSEQTLLDKIAELNADPAVDGIIVQLPLPEHISKQKVIDAIDESKDVDGFHPGNAAKLWQNGRAGIENADFTLPCTPKGVMLMLEAAGVNPDGKHAVVVGRSNIVGLPMAKLLLNANATVTVCHSHTRNLAAITRQADIIIAAIGQPRFITEDMVGEGATVIDVGINRDPLSGKLCGDVDYEKVAPKCSVISPVPGGVGPMTVTCLIGNTIEAFLRKQNK